MEYRAALDKQAKSAFGGAFPQVADARGCLLQGNAQTGVLCALSSWLSRRRRWHYCRLTTFLLLQELRDGVLEEVTLISVQLIEDLLVTLLICAELAIQFLRCPVDRVPRQLVDKRPSNQNVVLDLSAFREMLRPVLGTVEVDCWQVFQKDVWIGTVLDIPPVHHSLQQWLDEGCFTRPFINGEFRVKSPCEGLDGLVRNVELVQGGSEPSHKHRHLP
mmetsp:Transcript_89764/g.149239  ORF Transcript_89764/g.149239 Transcript_89764/m.149239 type:complete len:218 (-) Transcript_89764:962-1615(-)